MRLSTFVTGFVAVSFCGMAAMFALAGGGSDVIYCCGGDVN